MFDVLKKKDVSKYKTAPVPWGPIGYITYKRTYARRIEGSDRTEEWWETILRIVNGVNEIGAGFTKNELLELYDHLFNLRGLVSGRALWQLGSKLPQQGIGSSLVNCWGVAIDDYASFCFLFDQLMLGGGVGFNILPSVVLNIPAVVNKEVVIKRYDSNDADFIVSDKREGWVSLLRRVLKSYFITGRSFTYSLHCIRSKGAPIKGFGGVASGPEVLEDMVVDICKILERNRGKKLASIDCLDICNIIARCVVAGNVRRSAELAIGSIYDGDYLNAKRWDLAAKQEGFSVPSWRAHSNNSIVASDIPNDGNKFWELYEIAGEPYGLLNFDLARRKGRIIDRDIDDSNICVFNPCSEITLESYECCNLAELFLPRLESLKQAKRVGSMLFRVCKAITNLDFVYDRTNEVVHRNRRIGISISGWMHDHGFGAKELDELYKYLREYDRWLSNAWNVPESIKITTVQPSGTKSLLPGISPGIHPAYAKYYIRRIRMSSDNKLVEYCKSLGYPVEYQKLHHNGGEVIDYSTCVVSFPCETPDGVTLAKDISAIDQLEQVKFLQRYWSDNSVSVTVYYKLEELPAIKKWLRENFKENIKSVSFLLHQDHGFMQAPYEEINKEQYEKMKSKIKPMKKRLDFDTFTNDLDTCEGGVCPIR